ncbi:MAG: toxin-antitoxin system YwqK family antitoxin, partial [Bdellovibrionales bacterium]|nr:toxin-antitoxin system YwqK family antitoxin [Bdellovibrionales bacterium]
MYTQTARKTLIWVIAFSMGAGLGAQSSGAEDILDQGDCPSGTELKGFGPPKDDSMGCEREGGVKHGPFIAWHGKDGKMRARGEFREGKKYGDYVEWHPNGQKKAEGEYGDDEKSEGDWKRWYDNGQLLDEGEWKNGEPVGEWTIWHQNGNKKEQGEFEAGKKVEPWRRWDADGNEILPPESKDAPKKLTLRQFEISGAYAVQDDMSQPERPYSVSGTLKWRPTYQLSRAFSVRGGLGLTPFKDQLDDSI